MPIETPWIIEPDDLEAILQQPDICVVDLSSYELYQQEHIPNAVPVDYTKIVKNEPPILGLIPDASVFEGILCQAGIAPSSYVIAYDNEGSGKASRFLWTLEIAGHKKMSLLNGGLSGWKEQNKPITTEVPKPFQSSYKVHFDNWYGVADAKYILAHLNDPNTCVLDARTQEEYQGSDIRAIRAGHIPGAINLDWLNLKDHNNPQRLIPLSELKQMFANKKITNDKTIITHCQSHHRSALVYVALKYAGLQNVKGYPGSWSDWASRVDTPVENSSQ